VAEEKAPGRKTDHKIGGENNIFFVTMSNKAFNPACKNWIKTIHLLVIFWNIASAKNNYVISCVFKMLTFIRKIYRNPLKTNKL